MKNMAKLILISVNFMVAIAQYGTEEFALATIESPQFSGASVYCFKFFYTFHVIFNLVPLYNVLITDL